MIKPAILALGSNDYKGPYKATLNCLYIIIFLFLLKSTSIDLKNVYELINAGIFKKMNQSLIYLWKVT